VKLLWLDRIATVPELPEVETVVRDLRPLLTGRKIQSVRVSPYSLRRRWSQEWNKPLAGCRFESIHRRGKWIIAVMDNGLHLLFHLGMTGQMCVVPATQTLEDHVHLVMDLRPKGHQLRFRDVRRFGGATLFRSADELHAFFVSAKLGPEPFDLPIDYMRKQLSRTLRSLKAVLLDQTVVAGVGNIYADESLFVARLHPAQPGKDTTAVQARRLRDAIEIVLRRGIEQRGSSIRDYVDGCGRKGQYQEEFRVYSRTGQPCRRCGKPIECMRLAGRSTHFCPKCQRRRTVASG
jgi:formamidopyrimidine-DNA glycosylase